MTSTSVSIRDVTVGDARSVAVLVTELGYPTSEDEMAERLRGITDDPTYRGYVAERDGEVVGLVGGRIGRWFEKNGLHVQVVVMVVASDAHGSGIGTSLLGAIESWAIERGANELVLTSGSHRDDAHAFYERKGFTRTGVRFLKPL